MDVYATIDDYEARYGDQEFPERVSVMLEDATSYIASRGGVPLASDDPNYSVQQANLTRVACSVVHRALSAGQWTGLSSVSQTAGSYSASLSPANPTEDFYLTAEEKRSLGIGALKVGFSSPTECQTAVQH